MAYGSENAFTFVYCFIYFLNKTCFNVLKFVNGCPAPGGEAMF